MADVPLNQALEQRLGQTLKDSEPVTLPPDAELWPSPPAMLRAGIPGEDDQRYRIDDRLGRGANGLVLSVFDRSLQRSVAMKIHAPTGPDDDRGSFMREARFSARLEHPGIAPIYDLDQGHGGDLYFTMRMVSGSSFGSVLRRLADGESGTNSSLFDRVSIIIRVAETLAFAHGQGVIHRDVKPDNIMLGQHGEIMLVDWGAAVTVDEARVASRMITGTPFYMSPEQARAEPVDPRTDIYSLGASLFHALVLRPPVIVRSAEQFWEQKRSGVVDEPTGAESEGIPRQLLAICRKAMAPEAGFRYQKASELADDLRHWQQGEPVSVFRDPWTIRIARFARKHRRTLVTASAITAVVAFSAGLIWHDRLKDIATWGKPIYADGFDDASAWNRSWKTTAGSFTIEQNRLISAGTAASMASFAQQLSGSAAIEFTGRIDADSKPCDLSITYMLDDPSAGAGAPSRPPVRGFHLQAGALDNSCCQIVRLPDFTAVDVSTRRLETGRTYRIRGEIDGDLIRLLIDGEVVCSHREPVPLTAGWIGLFGYYPGKSFDDVRIFSKGMPQRVSVVGIGDRDFLDGEFGRAARIYQRIAEVHAELDLASEARFKAGLARSRMGDTSGALSQWDLLPPGRWQERARIERARLALNVGRIDEIPTLLEPLLAAHGNDAEPYLIGMLADAINHCHAHQELKCLERLLSLSQRMPRHQLLDLACASALLSLSRYDELFARYPDQVATCSMALIRLGRAGEILDRFADFPRQVTLALVDQGRIDEFPRQRWQMEIHQFHQTLFSGSHIDEARRDPANGSIDALLRLGMADTVLLRPAVSDDARIQALAALGRAAEAEPIARMLPLQHQWLSSYIYRLLNRPEDALRSRPVPSFAPIIAADRALEQCIAGIPGSEEQLRALPAHLDGYGYDETCSIQLIVLPVLRALHIPPMQRKAALLATANEHRWHFQQRPYWLLRHLAGEIDEQTFLQQPHRLWAASYLPVVRALRAEIDEQPSAAKQAWRSWLALPAWQRLVVPGGYRDPFLERFAHWRITVVAP